jgi:hypothetical protein
VRRPWSKIYEDACSATAIEQAADAMGISERDVTVVDGCRQQSYLK